MNRDNNYKTTTNPMHNNLPSKTLREASNAQPAFRASIEKKMKDPDTAGTQLRNGTYDEIETSGDNGTSDFFIGFQQHQGRNVWKLRRHLP